MTDRIAGVSVVKRFVLGIVGLGGHMPGDSGKAGISVGSAYDGGETR